MPVPLLDLNSFADKDPLLYETLYQMNQAILPPTPASVMSGVSNPTNSLAAPPNTVFYQTDAGGTTVTAKFLKTAGEDANGWVTIP